MYRCLHIWCQRRYAGICLLTLLATYTLIAAGSIVRSTQAGMGCPDWPKCYGHWLPPQDENQLPADYRAQYYAIRRNKNLRLASGLRQLGMYKAAEIIEKEALVFRSEHFNVKKAWIEYINRLLGVTVGVLVLFLCTLAGFGYLGTASQGIFWQSLAAGIYTVAASLLGAVVVVTHLLPFSVTLHMSLAFLLIGALISAYKRQKQLKIPPIQISKGTRYALKALFLLLIVQLLMGTQVREGIDHLLSLTWERTKVIDGVGMTFHLHRSISLVLISAQFMFCYWLWRKRAPQKVQRLSQTILMIYFLELCLGLLLYYAALPATIQPLHLLLAGAAYGLQWYLIVDTRVSKASSSSMKPLGSAKLYT